MLIVLPTKCGMAYESVCSLARGHVNKSVKSLVMAFLPNTDIL